MKCKCKHQRKHHTGNNLCLRDGSIRKNCDTDCRFHEPTFWWKLDFLLTYGKRWENWRR